MLPNIQGLRALAALMVAVGHLQVLFAAVHPALAWVGLGRAGVDLFFVISGFIMVFTTEREPPSAGRFALRRILRIVPLYWAVTLAVFALAALRPGLLDAGRADPVWLAKSLAFIPFDKGDGTMNPLVPVGWTLNYEMFFYALLALALIPPLGRARYILVAVVVAALALPGFFVSFGSDLLQFYTRPILIEFALGVGLGLAFARLPRARPVVGSLVLIAALAALAASGLAPT
ncbi:MAG TPA: acyltransferase, partial [Phenylobacterium sp.]